MLDLKPDAVTLNCPLLSALPVALDSGEDTVIVAPPRAPCPSTLKLSELCSARLTLTAASATDGRTDTAP